MAKYNLLKLTQKVLSSLSSDEVSSIDDTVESMQVVDIIEDVYYNMVENSLIPELEELIKLTALSDSNRPNYLKIPLGIDKITEVYYNISSAADTGGLNYKLLKYMEPKAFLRHQSRLTDETADSMVVNHFDGTKFVIINNRMPTYWTTFDDEYLVCDSYDSNIDDSLQEYKTMTMATKSPVFVRENEFIPDMDDNLFPMLLNEAKSWAYKELKQTVHDKAEQQSRQQKVRYQKHRERITVKNNRPDYGRR